MPWSVKPEDGQFCVFDKDGKKLKCYADKAAAEAYKKALYANEKKLEDEANLFLERVGPALVAAAVTSKPHLRQRGREIRIVEINGQKLVEVPLLRKGIYKHPQGNLVFNDAFIERMIRNHENMVSDYNVSLDFRHSDKVGALAFLDKADGGWLEVKDDWLYAYGPPVDEEAERLINSRKWRYASPEFSPDYESNLVSVAAEDRKPYHTYLNEGSRPVINLMLSADQLTETTIEELTPVPQSKVVKTVQLFQPQQRNLEVTMLILEDGTATLTADELQAVQDLEKKVKTLEAKIVELTPTPEPELPEAVRVRLEKLESENKQLAQQRMQERVNFVLEKARTYRDSRGYGHDKVFLELAEAGLLYQAYDKDGITVKLENADTPSGMMNFYRTLLTTMLEKAPGTVPMQGATVADSTRLENQNGHYSTEEFEAAKTSFWD